MSKKKIKLSAEQQIFKMYQDFAGEKLEKVKETTQKFVSEGKSITRAMADALEKHKCPNTYPDLQ